MRQTHRISFFFFFFCIQLLRQFNWKISKWMTGKDWIGRLLINVGLLLFGCCCCSDAPIANKSFFFFFVFLSFVILLFVPFLFFLPHLCRAPVTRPSIDINVARTSGSWCVNKYSIQTNLSMIYTEGIYIYISAGLLCVIGPLLYCALPPIILGHDNHHRSSLNGLYIYIPAG